MNKIDKLEVILEYIIHNLNKRIMECRMSSELRNISYLAASKAAKKKFLRKIQNLRLNTSIVVNNKEISYIEFKNEDRHFKVYMDIRRSRILRGYATITNIKNIRGKGLWIDSEYYKEEVRIERFKSVVIKHGVSLYDVLQLIRECFSLGWNNINYLV